MSKNIWESSVLIKPVETHGGGKIINDYSGLHKVDESNRSPITAYLHDSKAINYINKTERIKLNFGEDFDGFIRIEKIKHVNLYIAKHEEHGLCAFLNTRTSLHPSKIEILINMGTKSIIMDRNSFFEKISTETISDEDAQKICENYDRVYILLISS